MIRRQWTDTEVTVLRELYPHCKTAVLAAFLGRKEGQVYQKAISIGMRKTAAYLASAESGRLMKLSQTGAKTRFRKGAQPWNAGSHYVAGGRSVETRFGKNHLPHNTRPIGSYRITKDGTLQRKIGNAKGSNSKRWRGVHELVWIEAHGPVPRGHIVVFKPGMRTAALNEITVDRVECISLAENMRRNTYHRYPQPIPQLIQLRGALQRQINRREHAK